jgi:hypothetical protein
MELGSPADMRVHDRFPGNELALVLHDSGVRTGICSGVGLAVTMIVSVYVANRIPALERMALERNLVAAAFFGLFFLVPVVRFMWQPGRLLVSGLIAWSILAFSYRGLCMHFSALGGRFSAVQLFTLGAIVYMILATLSWIGTCIWRVRESYMANHRVSHSNHHL